MLPGETTTNANEQNVNVTNTGNTNINLSVNGFGLVENDNLSMVCTRGNISVEYIKYNNTLGQAYLTSMWNLTSYKIGSGIRGLNIARRVDDADNTKLNSTNSTYWKIFIPIGYAKGYCNGTVTFSAVV
jgi:hypothetical protein